MEQSCNFILSETIMIHQWLDLTQTHGIGAGRSLGSQKIQSLLAAAATAVITIIIITTTLILILHGGGQ
jgi:hypothetical protein